MEENLYDTSKLIDAYKNNEYLHGCTTILNLIEFPKAVDFNLKVIFLSKLDYSLALRISTELLKISKPIPAIDAVIAAIAINNGLNFVTKTGIFSLSKRLEKTSKLL